MWSTSKAMASRTPLEPVLTKEGADVTSARTPLQPSAASARCPQSGAKGADDRRKKQTKCCFCCCGRRKQRGETTEKKVKEKKGGGQQSYRSYTIAGNHGDRDGTLESGITGLSQLTDIPRYDSDADIETVAYAASNSNGKASSDASNKKKRCGGCGACGRVVRKFVRMLFSIIGMTALVAGYSIGGGFLFSFLETGQEQAMRHNVIVSREAAVESLWNTTQRLNVLHEELWRKMADRALHRFQHECYELTKNGWDGVDDVQHRTSWTFGASLLYSLTVITTIGYGNLTPKTILGRYLTILYAIVGIPLCVMWLTSIGALLATAFRFIYKHLCRLCRCLCCQCNLCRRWGRRKRPASGRGNAAQAEAGHAGGKGRSDGKRADEEPVRVPVYVSMAIMMLYIVLGAVLFSMWEDWEMSEAAYFCFITLATIGFGDFVPGFGTDMNQGKAIGNAVYLVLGLALLVMCFDLMRQEVTITAKNIFRKISSWTADSPETKVASKKAPKTATTATTTSRRSESKRHKSMGDIDAAEAEERLIREDKAGFPSDRKPMSLTSYNSKSMRALTVAGSEEDFGTGVSAHRGRVNTISGSSGRYGPMPHATSGGGGEGGGGSQDTRNPSNNNNNNSDVNKNSTDGSSGRGSVTVSRPVSVPPHGLAETVDLLEHMNLVRNASPRDSPKMRRRDRSRSPVRGRPKSRGPGSQDRGGNVDVATEEEDDDDDDDTLDAASVASSTDLIKVAQALRRERSERSERSERASPPVSPATTITSEDNLPAFAHPHNNVSMTTFRPAPPGGPQVQACGLIPTTSRPPSRCQSRARSTSPVSRTCYQQGFDVLSSSRPSSAEGEGEGEEEGVYGDGGGRSPDSEVMSRSAFSKPRPPSSMGSRVSEQQENYAHLQQQQQRQQQLQQQQQQRQQQHQQQRQQQLRQQQQQHQQQQRQQQQQQQQMLQQQQQQQQQYQQHKQQQQQLQQQQQHQQQRQLQHPKQANKVHNSDNVLPPRCISPMPKVSKNQHHKVAPPNINSADAKRPPPPTLPKTKKVAVASQAL